MTGIANEPEHEHTIALFRSKELSAEYQSLFTDIMQSKAVTKDRTSRHFLKLRLKAGELLPLE